MEKWHFWVFVVLLRLKSYFSYKKGMKTYDFLKIELACELIQKELERNIKMGRNENFI